MITLRLGDKTDLKWAQHQVVIHHYLHQPVHPRARPHCYIVDYQGERLGTIIVGIPHATRLRGWFGYPGLPTQWQVVDLCRIWLSPRLQRNGDLCQPDIVPGFIDRAGVWRPSAASWAIRAVLDRVAEDRVSLWPPVYLDQPYHIALVISYHDPTYHRGTIYRQTKALPIYTDNAGQSVPGPSGKFAWAWKLPAPNWTWQAIDIRQPRTLRMAFSHH